MVPYGKKKCHVTAGEHNNKNRYLAIALLLHAPRSLQDFSDHGDAIKARKHQCISLSLLPYRGSSAAQRAAASEACRGITLNALQAQYSRPLSDGESQGGVDRCNRVRRFFCFSRGIDTAQGFRQKVDNCLNLYAIAPVNEKKCLCYPSASVSVLSPA